MGEISIPGLLILRDVARSGSFSATAERMGYTQSAVSRRVALMEAAAGRPLFERHARGVRLTDAGRVLARRADVVVAELEAARNELDDLAETTPGRLRVGAFSTALAALVPRAMGHFSAQRPRTQLILREGMSDRLLARAADGRLDLAVVTRPADAPSAVQLVTLLEDPLLVAVGRGHRLAQRASVRADELREESWIAGSREPRSTLLGAWTESAWEPDIAYVARDWNAKIGLVAAGLGVTVVPGIALLSLPSSIAVARIEHAAATRTTAVASRAGASPDSRRDAFGEALHDAAAELLAEVRRRV